VSRAHPFSVRYLLRYAIQGTALGLVVTALIMLFTSDRGTFEQLRGFPIHYLPIMLGMVLVAWVCAGTRLWLIARSMGYGLPYRDMLAVGLASEFGVSASPAGVGGAAVRLGFLHRAGVPMHSALTVFAADSVLDTVVFLILSPLTILIMVRDPSWWGIARGGLHVGPATPALLVAGILLILLGIRSRRRLRHGIDRLVLWCPGSQRGRLPARWRHLQHMLRRTVHRAWTGTHFLVRSRPRVLLTCLLLSATQWVCRYGILPLILLAFHAARNPVPLLLLQGFFFALALVLVLPGGGGGIELLTTAVLRYFVPLPLIGVVVLLWRLFTYYLYLLVGGIVFARTCHKRMPLTILPHHHDDLMAHMDRFHG
jgi:glycosyltransferase 2 family protein